MENIFENNTIILEYTNEINQDVPMRLNNQVWIFVVFPGSIL